jgi:hypothetical protein
MEWFSTLTLALGSAWTAGINLYATVTILGLLQRFDLAKLPGGLDVLDNWWIIGVAGFLYLVEFFADKIPFVDSAWDVLHTFIRVPAGAVIAYAAVAEMDPAVYIIAGLIGGGLAFSSHGTKAAIRAGANLSPEPVSNSVLSLSEDVIAIAGVFLAVFVPIVVAVFLVLFIIFFIWFGPKVVKRFLRVVRAVSAYFRGNDPGVVFRKTE